MNQDPEQTLGHFRDHGWMRLRGVFDQAAAAAMREVAWQGLAAAGIRRDDPSTWTIPRPEKLQALKDQPAFQAVGGARLIDAIGALLGTADFERPRRWGALFVSFPTGAPWGVPVGGWHIDANYRSQLWPPKGVQTLALFGDVAPRGGGTLIVSGAHRLIARWFQQHPARAEAKSAELRRSLAGHPYIGDLHAEGDADQRIARFMTREVVDDIPLQVVECTGQAGDVFLLHPLTLHVASVNAGVAPRFLLSGGVTTDQHGWA